MLRELTASAAWLDKQGLFKEADAVTQVLARFAAATKFPQVDDPVEFWNHQRFHADPQVFVASPEYLSKLLKPEIIARLLLGVKNFYPQGAKAFLDRAKYDTSTMPAREECLPIMTKIIQDDPNITIEILKSGRVSLSQILNTLQSSKSPDNAGGVSNDLTRNAEVILKRLIGLGVHKPINAEDHNQKALHHMGSDIFVPEAQPKLFQANPDGSVRVDPVSHQPIETFDGTGVPLVERDSKGREQKDKATGKPKVVTVDNKWKVDDIAPLFYHQDDLDYRDKEARDRIHSLTGGGQRNAVIDMYYASSTPPKMKQDPASGEMVPDEDDVMRRKLIRHFQFNPAMSQLVQDRFMRDRAKLPEGKNPPGGQFDAYEYPMFDQEDLTRLFHMAKHPEQITPEMLAKDPRLVDLMKESDRIWNKEYNEYCGLNGGNPENGKSVLQQLFKTVDFSKLPPELIKTYKRYQALLYGFAMRDIRPYMVNGMKRKPMERDEAGAVLPSERHRIPRLPNNPAYQNPDQMATQAPDQAPVPTPTPTLDDLAAGGA